MVDIFTTLENARLQVERQVSLIVPTDEYDGFNYSELITSLNNYKRFIINLLSIYKFARMSKEYFLAQFGAQVESSYVVTGYDTPLSIAEKHGITLDTILELNNITTSEMVAGMTLKVPAPDQSVLQVYNNIPTFGDQTGDNVFGRDLPNELTAKGGELVVLEPLDTLKQGVNNRINTTKGDYPLDESFGHISYIDAELPKELSENMIVVDIVSQILQDPRIVEVKNINTTEAGNTITFTADATTITKSEITT